MGNFIGVSGGSSRSLSGSDFPMYDPFIYEIGYKKYPIVLLLQNHVEYDDHYVVAFKYYSFGHYDGTYSDYVQICDGWSSTANRYINFTKGFDSGSIYTITIHPN